MQLQIKRVSTCAEYLGWNDSRKKEDEENEEYYDSRRQNPSSPVVPRAVISIIHIIATIIPESVSQLCSYVVRQVIQQDAWDIQWDG